MYSMILVDDEKLVLQGIQKFCQKEDFGFAVKGAFCDPNRAMHELVKLRPDLIITDIRMPGMNGLDFAEQAKELLPDAEIVILSGYGDFTYAQTAIKIGVSDYLLKPIKKKDFTEMMHRLYARVDEKNGSRVDSAAGESVSGERNTHQMQTGIAVDALRFIRRHYNESISLSDVAEQINVNKSYLCDVFKKETDMTITGYITKLRVEKSMELLRTTDMKVYEIAMEVGYKDYTYFSQIFRKYIGISPAEYRKQQAG